MWGFAKLFSGYSRQKEGSQRPCPLPLLQEKQPNQGF